MKSSAQQRQNPRGYYVRLDDQTAKRLEEVARTERRSVCQAAAILIENGLAQLSSKGLK
jgi:hypothetical protein